MGRPYTKWIFTADYAGDTGIRIGYFFNKPWGNPEDIIHVRIRNNSGNRLDYYCRIDEAIVIASGLTKVAGQILVGQLPTSYLRECRKT